MRGSTSNPTRFCQNMASKEKTRTLAGVFASMDQLRTMKQNITRHYSYTLLVAVCFTCTLIWLLLKLNVSTAQLTLWILVSVALIGKLDKSHEKIDTDVGQIHEQEAHNDGVLKDCNTVHCMSKEENGSYLSNTDDAEDIPTSRDQPTTPSRRNDELFRRNKPRENVPRPFFVSRLDDDLSMLAAAMQQISMGVAGPEPADTQVNQALLNIQPFYPDHRQTRAGDGDTIYPAIFRPSMRPTSCIPRRPCPMRAPHVNIPTYKYINVMLDIDRHPKTGLISGDLTKQIQTNWEPCNRHDINRDREQCMMYMMECAQQGDWNQTIDGQLLTGLAILLIHCWNYCISTDKVYFRNYSSSTK